MYTGAGSARWVQRVHDVRGKQWSSVMEGKILSELYMWRYRTEEAMLQPRYIWCGGWGSLWRRLSSVIIFFIFTSFHLFFWLFAIIWSLTTLIWTKPISSFSLNYIDIKYEVRFHSISDQRLFSRSEKARYSYLCCSAARWCQPLNIGGFKTFSYFWNCLLREM